jgi:hypothetical protein
VLKEIGSLLGKLLEVYMIYLDMGSMTVEKIIMGMDLREILVVETKFHKGMHAFT